MTKKKDNTQALVKLAEEKTLVSMAGLGRVERSLAVSSAIVEFQKVLEPMLPQFLPLAGSPLGFQQDKQYPPAVVRDCLIEAFMLGLEPQGRHFAIIGGRLYIQQEGVRHLLRNFPGLSDLKTQLGVPEVRTQKGKKIYATVPFSATWKVDGQEDSLDAAIPVHGFDGPTFEDLLLGKAERKGLMRVFRQLTAGTISVGTVDDVEDESPPATVDISPPEQEETDEEKLSAEKREAHLKNLEDAAGDADMLIEVGKQIAVDVDDKGLVAKDVRALKQKMRALLKAAKQN